MKTILKLAVKNLTRQKRRSAILALAIAFGFFVVTCIGGLTTGAVGNLEDSITQLLGGTVLVAGYEKIPAETENGNDKLINIVRDKDYIKNLVENNNIKYDYFSHYTMSTGQLVFNGEKTLATVYGRDFEEKHFLDSLQVVKGDLNSLKGTNSVIINDSLAKNLNLEIGDELLYTTTTIYGQNNVADLKVGAIIKSTNFLTGIMLYTDINYLNQIVELPEGSYNAFTIFLKNKKESNAVAFLLENLIRKDGIEVTNRIDAFKTNPKNPGRGIEKQLLGKDYKWEGVKYAVETLDDEVPAIKTVLSVVNTVTTNILLVILLIVMVGVSNTYRMVLYERIREIGTMRALGMSGKDTGKVFTCEAIILCLIGALAGLILSIILMSLLGIGTIQNESVAFFLNKGHISFKLSFASILTQYILLILLTIFAVRGSAKKASQMSPAEALRTVK